MIDRRGQVWESALGNCYLVLRAADPHERSLPGVEQWVCLDVLRSRIILIFEGALGAIVHTAFRRVA